MDGPHILTQHDLMNLTGEFDDAAAIGGWPFDNHPPEGFDNPEIPPFVSIKTPDTYNMPLRSFYSVNIPNLFMAGRNISASHVAFGSTRVMGTCSVMGQALGTAASLACQRGVMPHAVLDHIGELQQMLLADDVFLPGVAQDVGELARDASLEASNGEDPEPLRDGVNRPVSHNPFVWMRKPKFSKAEAEDLADYDPHAWTASPGDHATYRFDRPTHIEHVTLLLDSNLERSIALKGPGWQEAFPERMPKRFRVEIERGKGWEPVATVEHNTQRHVTLPVFAQTRGVRFVLEQTHGGETSDVYSFLVHGGAPAAEPRASAGAASAGAANALTAQASGGAR